MGNIVTHSPGPWRCEPIPRHAHTDPDIDIDDDSVFWIVEDRVAGEVLALVQVVGDRNPGDAEANGRLMAMAPALLTALKETLAICETVMLAALTIPELDKEANAISDAWMLKAKELGIPDGFLDRAQAAIAKAEGR